MVTTDFRTIEFRTTPEGRNAAIAKLEAERQAEYDRILRQLDTYQVDVNTGGRPPLWLPPEIAQRFWPTLPAECRCAPSSASTSRPRTASVAAGCPTHCGMAVCG